MSKLDLVSGWSCDERNRAACRNPHGCHCREITVLRTINEPQSVQDGIGSIAAERRRQIEKEGWTPDHDDSHVRKEMAVAAACYAMAQPLVQVEREWVKPDTPKNWPWHFSWWKPGFRRQNLVKAGALIAAEIDRIDRASSAVSRPKPSTDR